MSTCFKCGVVDEPPGDGDGVGVCRICWGLACGEHGRLKGGEFWCVACLPKSVLESSLGKGSPPRPGGGSGGGVPVGPGAPTGGPGGGGAAAAAAEPEEPAFSSAAELTEWWPRLSAVTEPFREVWAHDLDRVVERVAALPGDDEEQARVRSLTTSAPPIINRLLRTGDQVGEEIGQARDAGVLDEELLLHALAIASWAVGAEPGEEPSAQSLYFLGDVRLRFVLKFYAPAFA
jgi:hypothetical protein